MPYQHEANLELAQSHTESDRINKVFYERFNYPWPPASFESFADPDFGITMLNQSIGNWQHNRFPDQPRIWVAGCGTNQAVYTALRFPKAQVLGTDISSRSLQICQESASQVGVTNLELQEISINQVDYQNEFDYIICTGVIHHNSDPQYTLNNLVLSLKPNGILELMVYNYYHTLMATAYQKAIRILCGTTSSIDLESEMSATKTLMQHFPSNNSMSKFLSDLKDSHEADLADQLLQPIGHTYTIQSLSDLVNSCDLEFVLPCINIFDQTNNRLSWNMPFSDTSIAKTYFDLSDIERWHITNLLMYSDSPMLWFYFQKKTSLFTRKSEQDICDEFLNTHFEKYITMRHLFFRTPEGIYELAPQLMRYPVPATPQEPLLKKIYDAVNPNQSMKRIIQQQGLTVDFSFINNIRNRLTTTAFPYIKAVVGP